MNRLRHTIRVAREILIWFSCAALTGCSATRERDPEQYLDERSAATIMVAAQPWTLARERPELAVNAREYLSLHAVEVNRSGEHRLYLLAHAWSTVDSRREVPQEAPHLRIAADGRLIDLSPSASDARTLGIGTAIIEPAGRHARVWYYPIEIETLAHLCASTHVQASFENDTSDEPYETWRDGSQPFRTFLERVR